jgi:hypothetical protein
MRSREDWERPKTNISGVFVVKLPGRGSKDPELALEIKIPSTAKSSPGRGEGTWSGGKAKLEELSRTLRPEAGQISRGP